MVELNQVSKGFSDQNKILPVLHDIELHLWNNEFVSIIGPSGCGKSTIFNIISGVLQPDAGTVYIEGSEVTGKTGLVSYMPQKDLLLPWRTVLDNVILPLEIEGVKKSLAYEEALPLFPLFELSEFERAYPHQLSGGMRQRTALLRTYLMKKKVMLLDEPFGSLDALTKRRLHLWLQEIWAKFKTAIMFITHDIDEALFLSDRIYVMTERPARIKGEVKVPLPRPRTMATLTQIEFIELKKTLLELL